MLGGVGAQQVVEGEPPGNLLGHQVRGRQLGQGPVRRLSRDSGQASRGGLGDIRPGVQAQQPEHPGGRLAEATVRPGEHRSCAAGVISGVEGVQPPAFAAQGGGHGGERVLRPGGGAGGGDVEGQRQPRAQHDELGGGRWLGGDPLRAEAPAQQGEGLGIGEHIHGQHAGAVGGDQPGQLTAAGHQDQAAGRAGEQGPYLRDVARVVQQDQHPPAGQQAAVQPGLSLRGGRNLRSGHAQRVQEPADRVGRQQRSTRRVVAAQVHVQLAVGKPLRDLVGPVHRQRRLAHPGRAVDRADHHRRREFRPVQQLGQHGQRAGPAGEVRHGRGQFPG